MIIPKRPRVLLVEDNPDDAAMLARALARHHDGLDIRLVTDGDEALAFIQRRGAHAQEAALDLVLLDLNLPGRDGFEVLDILKRDANLAALPVVILSSSCSSSDIGRAYRAHANAYIAKPLDLDFTEVARAIAGFWIDTARLPSMPWRAAC